MKNISIRLQEDFMKEAEKLAKFETTDKSMIIREALERGLAEIKLEAAIDGFVKEKLSISEAADMAGLGVGEIMDELTKRGIKQKFTITDIRGSLKTSLKIVK